MVRDADATRRRLLAAAIAEFAAHGLAGGRVDRIAAAAVANKRAIYDYFGSKEELFDAATVAVSDSLIAAVPLDGADLPGYAGALFDYLNEHPETARLIGWRRLERRSAQTPTSSLFFAQMSAVEDRRPASGTQIGPVDLVILVIALANAWELVGTELAARDEDPDSPARLAAHRAAVVEAARRLALDS